MLITMNKTACAVNACYCMIHDFRVMFEELFAERGLSLERLRAFCEIAEAAGVTRAAKGVMRQPQYSRQLRDLETYFGAALFVRKRNSFRPTLAGEKLLNVAKDFMAALEVTRKEVRALPQGVCIGAGESIFNWLLFPRLSEVHRLFPNYRFEFRNMRSNDIVRGLTESELDFGIVRDDACPPEITSKDLGAISYCLYLPKKFAGRAESKGDKQILDGLPLATLEGEGQFKTRLLKASEKNGIELDLRIVCSSFPLMTEILKQGHVAAILPNIAEVELPSSKFTRVSLKILNPMLRNYVLCFRTRTLDRREGLSRQLKAFVQVLQIHPAC
jgi:DNA-binding transcriptional LysR family regulator